MEKKNNKNNLKIITKKETKIKTNLKKNILQIISKWQTRPSQNQNLNQAIYAQAAALHEQHNCDAFFITLTLTREFPLIEQWKQMPKKINELLQNIKQEFMAVGAIISIEMHKKSSKYSKTARDFNAGYPHLHLILWTVHEFLNPTINNLRLLLLKHQFETNVRALPTIADIKKCLLYTIKESADNDLIKFCQQTIQWPANTLIWINHSECSQDFHRIQKYLIESTRNYKSYIIEEENPCQVPTTRRMQDSTLVLAELIKKLFIKNNWAIYADQIYEPIANAKFTWQPLTKLESWLTGLYTDGAQPKFLQILKESANWLYIQGMQNNKTIQFPIFPQLIIETNFVEFIDGVYNFKNGKLDSATKVSPFVSCTNYFPMDFHQIKPPLTALGFIYAIITRSLTEYNSTEKMQNIMWSHLAALGGLFHPEYPSKVNPAIYLKGEPSSYKTTFLKMLLEGTLGEHQIHYLSRNAGRFAFGFLTKQQKVFIVMDDVLWDKQTIHPGDLINILDKVPFQVENKNREPKQITFQGSLALTSNQDVYSHEPYSTMKTALQKRLHVIEFHPLTSDLSQECLGIIKEQSIAFSILINSIFLKQRGAHRFQIPNTWHSESSHLWHSEESQSEEADFGIYNKPFEKLGLQFYKHIIQKLGL